MEETVDIVREVCTNFLHFSLLIVLSFGIFFNILDFFMQEMNLLFEADQPGNQLDDYISRLNTILTQKAAGIFQLQAQLAQFQKRLNEYNVFSSSGD